MINNQNFLEICLSGCSRDSAVLTCQLGLCLQFFLSSVLLSSFSRTIFSPFFLECVQFCYGMLCDMM